MKSRKARSLSLIARPQDLRVDKPVDKVYIICGKHKTKCA